MAASIQDSCTKILNGVRNCSLNYSCQETPYSIYLTIRKSWSKHHQVDDLRKTPCEAVQNVSDKLLETKVSENVSLNTELAKVKVKLEESKDIISELEKKVDEAEAEVFQHHREAKQWKERVAKNEDEVKALKNCIKNHNAEILDAVGTPITSLNKLD